MDETEVVTNAPRLPGEPSTNKPAPAPVPVPENATAPAPTKKPAAKE